MQRTESRNCSEEQIRRKLSSPVMSRHAGENPKVVSERLGHASIDLTLDTYSQCSINAASGYGEGREDSVRVKKEAISCAGTL